MEFEDQEDQEEEMELTPTSFDPLQGNSSQVKKTSSGDEGAEARVAQTWKPRYKECLKNHAVGIAGHAVDGCREFMAMGGEGTLEALKCAACSCHRNFHRKETHDSAFGVPADQHQLVFYNTQHPQVPQFSPFYKTPTGYLHVVPTQRPLALALPLPSTSGRTHSRENQDQDMLNPGNGSEFDLGSRSRKRFRTKFTQEQKEEMLRLAEGLGWRIQKQDEEMVEQFCNKIGVKRHVLKVWMHNNKNTLGKKL